MNITQPSLGSIYIEMLFNGNRLLKGTGFLTKTNKGIYLITNRHNVTGKTQDTNQPIHKESGGIPNEIKIYHHKKNGDNEWISVIKLLKQEKEELLVVNVSLAERIRFLNQKIK